MTDLIALDDNSKVWVYHSSAPIPEEKISEVQSHIFQFVKSWVSHNKALKAYGNIFHNRLLCLFVDESQAGASGCSIDSSVKFIKNLGAHYEVDFFDRMIFSYIKNDEVFTAKKSELKTLMEKNEINGQTLFFDSLVKNKAQFISNWLVPLEESWIKRMV
jgi:DNA polymerase I-like protein with 3'-5' exonuclease and polymerase domains